MCAQCEHKNCELAPHFTQWMWNRTREKKQRGDHKKYKKWGGGGKGGGGNSKKLNKKE